MKHLIVAAFIATSAFGVFAQETQVPASADRPKTAVRGSRAYPPFDRAKFEERMKQRRAEVQAKVITLLKAAGVADEKTAELAAEIDKVYRPQRPQGMHRPPMRGVRPQPASEKKPTEQK